MMHRRCRISLIPAFAVATALLAAAPSASASGAWLVRDINPGGGSAPRLPTNVGGTLFFSARDGTHGDELWRSDGTAAGTRLVRDINPGGGSHPADIPGYPREPRLANVGGTLVFSADDGTHGVELWRSDGTRAGTRLVLNINPGGGDSKPMEFTNVGGTLFFSARDGTHGEELWRTDGTRAGTRLVRDINPDGYSFPSELTNFGGTLFFSADDGTHGYELWRTDGTRAGTRLVRDINPDDNSYPNQFTNVGGTLLFSADEGTHGFELWRTDGTAAGTRLVRDIKPGELVRDIKPGGRSYPGGSLPNELTDIGGTLFFGADDGTHGDELWRSDGTRTGTRLVRNIHPDDQYPGSYPNQLTDVGGMFLFSADDGRGFELWRSDGTGVGTRLVRDISRGRDFALYELTNFGGTLLFSVDDGTHGQELWRSDGTWAGTRLAHDINPGGGSSYPGGADCECSHLASISGRLFFSADDGVHGQELWKATP
jgi:ELWxxDGT repeat protein